MLYLGRSGIYLLHPRIWAQCFLYQGRDADPMILGGDGIMEQGRVIVVILTRNPRPRVGPSLECVPAGGEFMNSMPILKRAHQQ